MGSKMRINSLGPLFTKQTDILMQDLKKFRSCEIGFRLSQSKLDRHLSDSAAKMPVKFQSDTIIMTSNLMASRFHKILW